MPAGKELDALLESYNIADIPKKYGGEFDYQFGMPPSLDEEIRGVVTWMDGKDRKDGESSELPIGPMRWVNGEDGGRIGVAVGKVNGQRKRDEVLKLDRR